VTANLETFTLTDKLRKDSKRAKPSLKSSKNHVKFEWIMMTNEINRISFKAKNDKEIKTLVDTNHIEEDQNNNLATSGLEATSYPFTIGYEDLKMTDLL
jgi:hypothetical protein